MSLTRWEDLELSSAYPFDERGLDSEERRIWQSFPDDLRRLLSRCNGADLEHEYSFPTKLTRTQRDGSLTTGSRNQLTELWAFLPRSRPSPTSGPKSILHQHFGRHVQEDFLPAGVYVFGRCEQNCLVAVSTNSADYGAIYYWEWYWSYPWYKPFFDARIAEARTRWPKKIGEDHPDWPRLRDDFNYATIVQLAPSLDAWIAEWTRIETDDDA
jgi:hypothetical protein